MSHLIALPKLFSVTVLASALILAGCNDDDNDNASNNVSTSLVTKTENYAPQQTEADTSVSQKITYKMPSVTGGQTTATAVVMIPKGTMPTAGWPVIVWAHGTTGVADQCAPSNLTDSNGQFNLGGTLPLVKQLLSQGYAVIAPDYEGLGSTGIHPFLNAKSESQSIISALKAAEQQYRNQLSENWVVVGHSQGGHAAIAAAERADEAGLNFKGVVAYAPASNLDAILGGGYQQVANALPTAAGVPTAKAILPGLQAFSALVSAGIRESHPDFNYTDAFTSNRSATIAAKAESECITPLGGAFSSDITAYYDVPANASTLYPGLSTTFYNVPAIAEFLNNSKLATKQVSQPILIIQGEADTTVPAAATRLLESQLKEKGNTVNVAYLPGKDHGTVITEGTSYLYGFLQQNMPAK